MKPRQGLANAWNLLRCDLLHNFPLFILERGEPRVDENPICEQSTGMYEPQTPLLQLRPRIPDLTRTPIQPLIREEQCIGYLLLDVPDGVLLNNVHDQVRPALREPDRQVPRRRLRA